MVKQGEKKKTFIVREESGKEGVGPAVPAFLWLSYLIYKWCQKKGRNQFECIISFITLRLRFHLTLDDYFDIWPKLFFRLRAAFTFEVKVIF
jgi:hypothetical protein